MREEIAFNHGIKGFIKSKLVLNEKEQLELCNLQLNIFMDPAARTEAISQYASKFDHYYDKKENSEKFAEDKSKTEKDLLKRADFAVVLTQEDSKKN